MTQYRNRTTGAVRTFEGRAPGHPWEAVQAVRSLSSMTKADLVAEADAAGLDSLGTADELRERIRAHRATQES